MMGDGRYSVFRLPKEPTVIILYEEQVRKTSSLRRPTRRFTRADKRIRDNLIVVVFNI